MFAERAHNSALNNRTCGVAWRLGGLSWALGGFGCDERRTALVDACEVLERAIPIIRSAPVADVLSSHLESCDERGRDARHGWTSATVIRLNWKERSIAARFLCSQSNQLSSMICVGRVFCVGYILQFLFVAQSVEMRRSCNRAQCFASESIANLRL